MKVRGELFALSGAVVLVSAASADAYVLATSILGVVGLVLHHLKERPSREQDERITKIEERLDAVEGRASTLETWRNG